MVDFILKISTTPDAQASTNDRAAVVGAGLVPLTAIGIKGVWGLQ